MVATVRELLESFDALSEKDKHVVATEILRRSTSVDIGLSDEALCLAGEELFLAMDATEAAEVSL